MSQLDILVKDLESVDIAALGPIDLGNGHGLINDVVKFLDSHLATLRRNTGNKTYMPFFERVKIFHSIVINK